MRTNQQASENNIIDTTPKPDVRNVARGSIAVTALVLLMLVLCVTPAYAAITATGDVTPAYTGVDPWDVSSNTLYVGNTGTGTLQINDASWVTDHNGFIGYDAGSDGIATVTGAGSVWNSSSLEVGYSGTGTLHIKDGGTVNSSGATVGFHLGSTGTAVVSGVGSTWNNSDLLFVGSFGKGSLRIEDGGEVNSRGGLIGSDGSSPVPTGLVTVTGAGSVWNSGGLTTGVFGSGGVLRVEDGATVNSTAAVMSFAPNTTGMATVTGKGSVWNNSGMIELGGYGAATFNIENGALVTGGDGMKIGLYPGGQGTVNLDGGILDLNGADLAAGDGTAAFNFTGGTLKDAATIGLKQPFVQDGGTLAPGGSIGHTHIVGDYNLTSGTIEVQLGGVDNPHDLLTAIGNIDIAIFGTTLDLSPIGAMAAGTYMIIKSIDGTITGQFEHITGLGLYPGLLDVNYGSHEIAITLNHDYVPEPGTAGLLGLMLWGCLRRWVV